jgi:hypothetical protein
VFDVAVHRRGDVVALQPEKRDELRDAGAFHVERAAAHRMFPSIVGVNGSDFQRDL